jgi:hypothetical protein
MGLKDRSPARSRPQASNQNRVRIAQAAARLIVEHGITDWTLAKRKAARQLMLPEREALPGDDEVAAALAEHHALFAPEAHARQLRAQRESALRWMGRLAHFEPLLTGGVAAGWATEHSDIRIELVAADPKAVELVLLNAGVIYRTMSADRDGAAELLVNDRDEAIRLSVRTPEQARQRPRRDRHGQEEVRLTAEAVEALLNGV